MNNLFLYLLKVSAGMAVFYIFYLTLFGKDTFYFRNRILLLCVLFLPVLLPILEILISPVKNSANVQANAINTFILAGPSTVASISEKIDAIDYKNLLIWLYLSVVFVFIIRLIVSLSRTLMIIKSGHELERQFPRIILSELKHPPFSFFPFVVLPKQLYEGGDFKEILNHEYAHIKQGHTFDLIVSELFIAFFWFNPFAWFVKQSIILNHEYLADNYSIKNSSGIREYQYKLLSLQLNLKNVPFAHNFSCQIKNRIAMINKKPSLNSAVLKNFFIIPIITILLIMFSFKQAPIQSGINEQEQLFSKSSQSELYKFIFTNIKYPSEAKTLSDSGRVYIVVRMDKGGIINKCEAFTEKDQIKVPILEEVVVTSIANVSGNAQSVSSTQSKSIHPVLKEECLRISNMLGSCNVPEWKDKEMEFALAFKFQLK